VREEGTSAARFASVILPAEVKEGRGPEKGGGKEEEQGDASPSAIFGLRFFDKKEKYEREEKKGRKKNYRSESLSPSCLVVEGPRKGGRGRKLIGRGRGRRKEERVCIAFPPPILFKKGHRGRKGGKRGGWSLRQ